MRRSPIAILIAVQLSVLVVVAAWTVARFPVWALTDELPHFQYVLTVGQDARLPVLGEDKIPPETFALGRQPMGDPAALGLRGESYEAFQPPLYYVVLAPVTAIGGERLATVRVLRAAGAAFLLLASWLAWLLARRVTAGDEDGEAPLAAYALALTVFVLPAVVVRNVTIANTSLALPFALLVTLLCWDALERRDARRLVLAGLALGFAMLTRLELVVLAPLLIGVAWILWRRGDVRPGAVLAALAAPVVLLAPWLAWNLHEYGALTASGLAKDMQEPVLNPTGRTYGLGDLDDTARRIAGGFLPEEWWVHYLSGGWRAARDVVAVLAVVVAPVLALVRPPARAARAVAFLVMPLVLTLAGLLFVLFAGQFDLLQPRYLHPVLPAYALFVALVLRRWLAPRAIAALAAVVTLGGVAVWLAVAEGPTYVG